MAQIGIFGLGLIGQKRLHALAQMGWKSDSIFGYDPANSLNENDSKLLTKIGSPKTMHTLGLDYVIVATPHDKSVELTERLLDSGATVLLEKPMGRNLIEAKRLHENSNHTKLSLGFNYRFMPAILELKHLIEDDGLGDIHTVKLELGHGGSPGDDKTWKLDPVAAGGGALLDPGVHLLDLVCYMFGITGQDLDLKYAASWNGFWNTGIEESVNILCRYNKMLINISLSIVAWKTRFKIEVIGTEGYAEVSGRGRSDGPQTLITGKRWGWKHAKNQFESELCLVHSKSDDSILRETIDWLGPRNNIATSLDGLNANELRQRISSIMDC